MAIKEVDAIEQLKQRAKRLLKRVRDGDDDALARVRSLPEFRDAALTRSDVQHKHCLAVVGRQLGFCSWAHAQRVLRGDPNEDDYGTLLHPGRGSGFTNQWFAAYREARQTRELTGGYLLTYRRQFFVVSATYLEAIGFDPAHPDWEAIDRDWVRPADPSARARLYATIVRHRLAAA